MADNPLVRHPGDKPGDRLARYARDLEREFVRFGKILGIPWSKQAVIFTTREAVDSYERHLADAKNRLRNECLTPNERRTLEGQRNRFVDDHNRLVDAGMTARPLTEPEERMKDAWFSMAAIRDCIERLNDLESAAVHCVELGACHEFLRKRAVEALPQFKRGGRAMKFVALDEAAQKCASYENATAQELIDNLPQWAKKEYGMANGSWRNLVTRWRRIRSSRNPSVKRLNR